MTGGSQEVCVREAKLYLHPSEVFSWDSLRKRLMNKRKNNSLLTCIPHVDMGDTQGNMSSSQR